jgi:hypothetical protein
MKMQPEKQDSPDGHPLCLVQFVTLFRSLCWMHKWRQETQPSNEALRDKDHGDGEERRAVVVSLAEELDQCHQSSLAAFWQSFYLHQGCPGGGHHNVKWQIIKSLHLCMPLSQHLSFKIPSSLKFLTLPLTSCLWDAYSTPQARLAKTSPGIANVLWMGRLSPLGNYQCRLSAFL